MYKTKGEPHKYGINGEQQVLNFLNDPLNFNFVYSSIKHFLANKNINKFQFVLKGNTSNREDISDDINNIKISIKTKKIEGKNYKGTFDLLNTSSIQNYMKSNLNCLNKLDEYNNFLNSLKNNTEYNINSLKQKINKYCNEILNLITGKEILEIFDEISKLEKNLIVLIRDYKGDNLDNINYDDLHFLHYEWLEKEIKKIDPNQIIKSNKKSAFIKNIDGTNSIFRIRVTLNNGVSALSRELNILPKIKTGNNTSKLTFKIQLDKVKYLVDNYDVSNKKLF